MTHQSVTSKMGSPNFDRPRTAGSCLEPGSTSLPPMLAIPDAGLSSALMRQATSPTSPLEENPLLSVSRPAHARIDTLYITEAS
jgi:hypothetical protein